MNINKKGECIRSVANYSLLQDNKDRFDKKTLDLERFTKRLEYTSPKLKELINTINTLDAYDIENEKTLYKHIIYTDSKKAAVGVKLVATGLLSNGFTSVYDRNMKLFDKLYESPFNNFAILTSGSIFDKPSIPIGLKKKIIKVFNNRANNKGDDDTNMQNSNVHGRNIRFIVLDQGYKEGIDLFDVKYVHLLEPLITKSDEKQVVGRGTRFCGQKGLTFDPQVGWPLHVFKYDVYLDEDLFQKYKVQTLNELFISNSGIDMKKLNFSNELDSITKYGAVDYELTQNIHNLSAKDELNELTPEYYFKYKNIVDSDNDMSNKMQQPFNISGGSGMPFLDIRKYVRDHFSQYKWDKIVIQNKCIAEKKKSKFITLTPSQEFISRYFQNESPYKGLFLWHSVGTGKTCSAISIASRGFEEQEYTILWVTRHTLKKDIWKNMFSNVCSEVVKKQIKSGKKIPPDAIDNPFKYLSKAWVQPISYKQFSNMLQGKNEMYNEMVKRNGKEDILKNTLVIIDEVHKLYATDLPLIERPDVNTIKKKIKDSYKISGKNSVRLLLMSATPYTNNPMDLIKFINFFKEGEEMPENFEEFRKFYLDENGKFTKDGVVKYLNEISPYISYLNRERDIQQFAYPVYYDVRVDISRKSKNIQKEMEEYIESLKKNIEELTSRLPDKTEEEKQKINESIEQHKQLIKEGKNKLKDIKAGVELDESQEKALEKCILK